MNVVDTYLVVAQTGGGAALGGWYAGLVIGFVVVVVVVVIVGTILSLASKIVKQAGLAAAALDDGQAHTLPLWDVAHTTRSAKAILNSATIAREALEEKLT